MIDRSPVPLVILDDKGVCLVSNPAFREQLGGELPQPFSEYFPASYPVRFELVWTVCQVIGGFRGMLESRHLDTGEQAMFELVLWRNTPESSQNHSYSAMLQPVTDRVKQERNRGDWQARFERAIRVSGDGILDWDIDHRRAFFSSRFRAILSGDDLTEPVTLAVWKKRIMREDRRRVTRMIDQHLARPGEPFEIEHRVCTPSGAVRSVVLRGQAIADASGRPYRLICSLRDTTDQREMESRTRQLLGELAHVQRQSTAGELAASISHELNQPLAAIATFAAGGLRRGMERMDVAEWRDLLQKIRKQALRGGEIIRRLRQFVRRELVPHVLVDVNSLAREVIELLAPEALDRQTTLAHQLCPSPLVTMADPIQLQQVMVNLLRNAFDAVDSLPSRRRLIRIVTQANATTLDFIVEDQGNGIDPEIFANLGMSIQTKKKDGLGMGLSLSRSIIQSHAGQLVLHPATIGTKIGFALPLLPENSRGPST
jgi:PAS domain S-box-containing protein